MIISVIEFVSLVPVMVKMVMVMDIVTMIPWNIVMGIVMNIATDMAIMPESQAKK